MKNLSKYLCLLLRHKPEDAELDMDEHGWVSVKQLIENVNKFSKYRLSRETLERLVGEDEKGRYLFDERHKKIKCCQGHSVSWVVPELEYREPPDYLYHGTNTTAMRKIDESGEINRMKRHAVHLQADKSKAWQSAERWKNQTPVILKVDAAAMCDDGFSFGVSENDVWCTESVPVKYIIERIYKHE
ncbi:MAG: RNA 2'-phosphotransferase [Ruminococcus sp.]|nr:RNA 2'-phosphotransferase [Ruminococcus sp.]